MMKVPTAFPGFKAALVLGTAVVTAVAAFGGISNDNGNNNAANRSKHLSLDNKLQNRASTRTTSPHSAALAFLPLSSRFSIPFPTVSPTRVHCEAMPSQEALSRHNHSDTSSLSLLQAETSSLATIEQNLANNTNLYQRMNPPSRMKEHQNTHAVGQLLRPHKIERYEVYKHVQECAQVTASTIPQSSSSSSSSSSSAPHYAKTVTTALVRFGTALDGHPGIVHGGILALVLDDIFGFSFYALDIPVAVTANLNLDYRAPVPANTTVIIQVVLEQWDNRKLYFRADIMSPENPTLIYTEATCLYIIPRNAWEAMQQQ